MKLGIIVPYRKRPGHLRKFQESISKYFKGKDYHLIIVEQADDLPFNRGKLLNIGFQYALRQQCDYVAFHDIDMLPIDVDYSYSDVPIHLATNFTNSDREIFDTYFGGVTLFPVDLFKKVNGYSNEYWGWGFEDDDLLMRLTEQNVFTDFKTYDVPNLAQSGIYLHNDTSYVKCPNTIDLRNNFTIHTSFRPDDIVCDYNKTFDEYCVFSIPGWDTTIAYNSFNRYKFEYWDTQKNPMEITSKYDYPRFTSMTITHDATSRLLTVYQDGKEIGSHNLRRRMLDTQEENFYLGVGIPERDNGDIKSFVGFISEFAYWNDTLGKNEVKELDDSMGISLLNNYEQYSSAEDLKIYYDFKHINLDRQYEYGTSQITNLASQRVETADCYNCIPKTIQDLEQKRISIPARRNSTFEMLDHETEGYRQAEPTQKTHIEYTQSGWKTESTRKNQIRFYRNVINNETNLGKDGLSSLKYTASSKTELDNYTMLSVRL